MGALFAERVQCFPQFDILSHTREVDRAGGYRYYLTPLKPGVPEGPTVPCVGS